MPDTQNHEELTKRQIASRENGKLGGVKTPEGKDRSKYNAYRHGLYAKRAPILSTEDQQAYESLAEQIHDFHQPVGPQEADVVNQLVDNMWRYHRYDGCQEWIVEAKMAGQSKWVASFAPEGIENDARHALAVRELLSKSNTSLRELSRMIDRLQRGQQRLLKMLKDLQGPRFNQGARAPQKPVQKPGNEPGTPIKSTPAEMPEAAWEPIIPDFPPRKQENRRSERTQNAPLRHMVA
jgi:hypothetical protein